MVDFYGWDILDIVMCFNCFYIKFLIVSSVKYLNKIEWVWEKLENFYFYCFKCMFCVFSEEFIFLLCVRIFFYGLYFKELMVLMVDFILKF